MPVDVSTPVYDGPFDLLLHLILREEVELYEVPLHTIVDAYLTELDRMDDLDLDVATEFVLIAATLVELKARRLLPDDDDLDLDEELALWEERDLLLARLVECKTFKDVARAMDLLATEAATSFPRYAGLEDWCLDLAPDLLAGVTPIKLRDAFERATAPTPEPVLSLAHIAPIKLTVAEAVEELVDELPRSGSITFRQLTTDLVDRIEVVIRFLAVLELFKQGVIDLDQARNFGEIQIRWLDPGGASELVLATVDAYDG